MQLLQQAMVGHQVEIVELLLDQVSLSVNARRRMGQIPG